IKNHFPVNGNTPKGDDLFLKLLQLQIDDYSKLPDEPLLNQAFKNLKEYVNKLEQKHIKVTFFEMPVNSQLLNLPKANVIRNTFYKNFPESKYSYIPLPDSLKFTTTDGLHLTPEEAARYTSYLKNEIKNTNR
ncbi:MAG: hypothetical protein ACJ751_17440, partial [Niastella sp.]|uniref:hypothetical protein n=1 Tax=Niastella sp. TaxID=1869183 RepID=UPI003899A4D5